MTNDDIVELAKEFIRIAKVAGADKDDYDAALSIANAIRHREWERQWKEEMAKKEKSNR